MKSVVVFHLDYSLKINREWFSYTPFFFIKQSHLGSFSMFLCNPHNAFPHACDQSQIPFKNIIYTIVHNCALATHHFSRSPLRSESPKIFSVVSANSMKLATKPRMPHLPLRGQNYQYFHLLANFERGWKFLKFFEVFVIEGSWYWKGWWSFKTVNCRNLCFGGLASSILLICCCITLMHIIFQNSTISRIIDQGSLFFIIREKPP